LKIISSVLLKGRLLTLHKNNRLGWEGLPGTNTLSLLQKNCKLHQ
jgi:hypothetical protein